MFQKLIKFYKSLLLVTAKNGKGEKSRQKDQVYVMLLMRNKVIYGEGT